MTQAITPETRTRAALVLCVLAGALLAYLATDPQQAATALYRAGPELTRLLRGMALIKALIAASAVVAVFWRLQFPATRLRATAYSASCAAMASGPFLIWDMAHIIAGALLLHAGLIAAVLLGWRDETVSSALTSRLPGAKARTPMHPAMQAGPAAPCSS